MAQASGFTGFDPGISLLPDAAFWRGKKVFLTGHTGFKGAWMTLWLSALGARVCGYSLPPDTVPNLYDFLNIAAWCEESHLADIRDCGPLSAALTRFAPEIVLHMAAQPLVRRSYREPLATMATNINGTAHVLEACRHTPSARAIVVITTDKCYKNVETSKACVEDDPLGGYDIYSASKACAEIITHAYRQSFFSGEDAARVATARAGNVIGGGDWSEDRLIPDAVRAFSKGDALSIRSPKSVRPWQHVAEPLLGYLMLAKGLAEGAPLSPAYNFGPDHALVADVERVINVFAARWQPQGVWRADPAGATLHEAKLLMLDSSLARSELGWRPSMNFEEALHVTADWYSAYYQGAAPERLAASMLELCTNAASPKATPARAVS